MDTRRAKEACPSPMLHQESHNSLGLKRHMSKTADSRLVSHNSVVRRCSVMSMLNPGDTMPGVGAINEIQILDIMFVKIHDLLLENCFNKNIELEYLEWINAFIRLDKEKDQRHKFKEFMSTLIIYFTKDIAVLDRHLIPTG